MFPCAAPKRWTLARAAMSPTSPRIVQWRAKRTALMRALIVEMTFILGQDTTQVTFTVDQQVIEALTA